MPSKKTTKTAQPPLWTRAMTSLEATRDTLPDDFGDRPTLPSSRVVEAPPTSPTPVASASGVNGVDERLAAKVGERLSESKALDDQHLELRVNDGEVELGGVVASEADSIEAEHLASSVRGVIRVVNHLTVRAQEVGES